MTGFVMEEGRTDLMSWDFFSVAGVMVGGLLGNAGREYSDIDLEDI